jgi:hypothetical protein
VGTDPLDCIPSVVCPSPEDRIAQLSYSEHQQPADRLGLLPVDEREDERAGETQYSSCTTYSLPGRVGATLNNWVVTKDKEQDNRKMEDATDFNRRARRSFLISRAVRCRREYRTTAPVTMAYHWIMKGIASWICGPDNGELSSPEAIKEAKIGKIAQERTDSRKEGLVEYSSSLVTLMRISL